VSPTASVLLSEDMSRGPLAPQQRTDLSRLAAPVGLPQDRELVLRREPTAARPLDELRVGHRLDVLRTIGSLPLAYGSLQRTDRDPIACVLRQFANNGRDRSQSFACRAMTRKRRSSFCSVHSTAKPCLAASLRERSFHSRTYRRKCCGSYRSTANCRTAAAKRWPCPRPTRSGARP
jgi:hypothetical protein